MSDVFIGFDHALKNSSVLAYFFVFLGGLFTGFSPCILPFFPVIIGYVAKRTTNKSNGKLQGLFLSVAFTLGFALVFAVIGSITSIIGFALGGLNRFLYIIAAIIFILIGMHYLEVYQLNLSFLPKLNLRKPNRKGFIGAFSLGILLGLVLTPCATPVVAAILAYVTAKGSVLFGASLLFTYGIAHGLPLIIVGTSVGAMNFLLKTSGHRKKVEIISGAVFIALGFYFLWIA